MRGVMQASVQSIPIAVRDAVITVAACAAIAFLVNAVRSEGIPLVQHEDYQIMVPCPVTSGEVTRIAPGLLSSPEQGRLIIDSRELGEFTRWHVPEAIHIPYDYLDPTPPETIQRIASSGARSVVVIGDGLDPDSGEQLARELSGKGIRNVGYVTGGAPAIQADGSGTAAP
jgi:hypothetical protein